MLNVMQEDKILNYIDKVKTQIHLCMDEYHKMDVRSREDALDIAVKLYYLQTITNDIIEDLRKGGDK